MGRVAAIGESVRTQGLALAGVLLLPGDDPEQVQASWDSVPEDVSLILVTDQAAGVLGPTAGDRMVVVMPP
jgi:vacuolar-type H+-ATPase subunit F/Vma7